MKWTPPKVPPELHGVSWRAMMGHETVRIGHRKAKNMTSDRQARARLANVVKRVMEYRGYSPQKLAARYAPEKPPLSAPTIYRIVSGEDEHVDDEMKLLRLSGMLRLPPATLHLVYRGDTAGIGRLEFGDEEPLRQFVLDLMDPPAAAKPVRHAR